MISKNRDERLVTTSESCFTIRPFTHSNKCSVDNVQLHLSVGGWIMCDFKINVSCLGRESIRL